MTFSPNIFALTLFISGICLLMMTVLIFRKLGGIVKSFGFVMLAISFWALCYAAELASSSLDQMLFFLNFEYIGIAFLPAMWILFIFRFIGKDRWFTWKNLTLVLSIPVITMLMELTNRWHHLYYAEYQVDASGPFPLFSFTQGIWYKINTVYFYSMLLWGLYLMIRKFRNADAVFRKQNNIILFSALIPWLANICYLLNLRPFGHVDLTPYAFILTAFFIGYGLLRFRLFDIIPIAREKVIEALGEGVLVLDSKNRVVDSNRAMRKILAKEEQQIVGSALSDLFPDQISLNDLLFGKAIQKKELVLSHDGDLRFYEVTITSLFESNTVYSGNILLFKDITGHKLAEEKLRVQAEQFSSLSQLKDKLFSIISHDLRSPLLSLLDVLSMANEGSLSGEELREFLPSLHANVEYTSGLVDNLLVWSKSQLKGELVTPERFDLKAVTGTRLGFQEKQALDKKISIEDQVAAGSFVMADKSMVQLIIRNLVSNAVKFCNPGDLITITAKPDDAGQLAISVNDTGIGMKPEVVDRIFGGETFSTMGTGNELGTGLGLLICKDFVEKNGGRMWVKSEFGKGSTFSFTLPAA